MVFIASAFFYLPFTTNSYSVALERLVLVDHSLFSVGLIPRALDDSSYDLLDQVSFVFWSKKKDPLLGSTCAMLNLLAIINILTMVFFLN